MVVAESGIAAVQAIRQREYRVLITDINLGPGPSGWDVARSARERDGGVAVIYVTGAEGGGWRSKRVEASVLLEKPFSPEQIVGAVEQLIGAPHGE